MRDGSERRVGQAASPRSWWRIIWACSALNGGNRSAVVFAACRIASRSVSLRASSSIASRGSVVVVGVLVWGVGMLFIPDRCVHTPAHRKKQPLHLAIQGKASYYMCMFSAVVPVKAPGSGPGTGVPIRHPRSSNPSGLPVVKILHHRQHPIRQGSTVVANCHHRHPRDRPGSTVPARCRHRRLTVDLHGGAILAPPSGGGDGGENFAPPWPGARSCKFCGTAAVAQRSRKFSGPVGPSWLMARSCRFGTTVLGPTAVRETVRRVSSTVCEIFPHRATRSSAPEYPSRRWSTGPHILRTRSPDGLLDFLLVHSPSPRSCGPGPRRGGGPNDGSGST
ncbi:Uncharacterised protein [Brevibacterium casei]|uniref:Uncharacterized protein n=1 Tax=Brevibacterium casei TaxID=33889 RepID=A0A449DB70_9MICO|nr:Uncharacterised protein [Brevibacterium casei]